MAGSVLAVLGGYGLWPSWRLWHDVAYAERMMLFSSVLPFSAQVRRGMVRGSLPLAIGLDFAAVAILVYSTSNPVQGRPQVTGIAAAACLLLMLIFTGIHVAIIQFNRPCCFVPPGMRSERGAFRDHKRNG